MVTSASRNKVPLAICVLTGFAVLLGYWEEQSLVGWALGVSLHSKAASYRAA